MRRARWLLIGLALVVIASAASAKPCGDDVEGRDVPCACGDVLVSDLALTDDPIGTEVCPEDGLFVRAAGAARGVTIDLRGHTLRGSGRGVGVWVMSGGPGGAAVISSTGPATIADFEDGVMARGADALVLLQDVSILRSRRDGVRVHSPSFELRSVDVQYAGRDGFDLGGNGYRIAASRALGCGRFGFLVNGVGAEIGALGEGAVAEGNARAGFNVMGAGHRLADCRGNGNGGDGVTLAGMQYDVSGCTAQANAGTGISGVGGEWVLTANHANNNGGNGLAVRGARFIDGGGNAGSDNYGRGQGRAAVQCMISGTPCLE